MYTRPFCHVIVAISPISLSNKTVNQTAIWSWIIVLELLQPLSEWFWITCIQGVSEFVLICFLFHCTLPFNWCWLLTQQIRQFSKLILRLKVTKVVAHNHKGFVVARPSWSCRPIASNVYVKASSAIAAISIASQVPTTTKPTHCLQISNNHQVRFFQKLLLSNLDKTWQLGYEEVSFWNIVWKWRWIKSWSRFYTVV